MTKREIEDVLDHAEHCPICSGLMLYSGAWFVPVAALPMIGPMADTTSDEPSFRTYLRSIALYAATLLAAMLIRAWSLGRANTRPERQDDSDFDASSACGGRTATRPGRDAPAREWLGRAAGNISKAATVGFNEQETLPLDYDRQVKAFEDGKKCC